jgi:hypothetical protein
MFPRLLKNLLYMVGFLISVQIQNKGVLGLSAERYFADIAQARLKKMRARVGKLLKLSKDSGAMEGESQAAMLMAQKIASEGGFSIDDFNLEDVPEEAKSFVQKKEAYHKPITDYMNLLFWHELLSQIIGDNFKCFVYNQHWRGAINSPERGKKRIIFLGLKEDTTIAADVFDFAVKAIEHLSRDYMDTRDDLTKNQKRAVKNDYIRGYLHGLKEKFAEQVKELQIALIHHELVVYEYDKLDLKAGKKMNIVSAGDYDAMHQGYQDGKNFGYSTPKIG